MTNVEFQDLPTQQAKIRIYDVSPILLWQAQRDFSSETQRILTANDLAKVFGLLDTAKNLPQIALLSPNGQKQYKQALYFIDKRGEDNLQEAIAILDALLYEQPDI